MTRRATPGDASWSANWGSSGCCEDVASAAAGDQLGRHGSARSVTAGAARWRLLAALRLGLPSVSYYGARNVPFLHETPKAPVMFHFGEKDQHIPPAMVAKHRELMPQMEVFTYPADHGFNRDVGAQYDEASAELALQRTLAFFDRQLASA